MLLAGKGTLHLTINGVDGAKSISLSYFKSECSAMSPRETNFESQKEMKLDRKESFCKCFGYILIFDVLVEFCCLKGPPFLSF